MGIRHRRAGGHASGGLIMAAALLLAGLGAAAPARALPEGFVDKEDNYLDISEWLIERKGFLPVPIIISEPAIGYGGGLALMFLRNSMRESAEKARESGLMIPPDIWVIAALGTENGTKAAFAGGMASFDEGRWKYRGGIGRAQVNLAFYGIGEGPLGGAGAGGIDYTLDGWMSMQQALRRLGQSNYWLGARWLYLDLDSKLDISGRPDAGLRPDQATRKTSGLGLTLEQDSRDNIFTPSSGWKAALDATFYDPDWGSDTRFQAYRAHVFAYWPLEKSLVLGTRLDGRAARGQVPFYMLPFIDMRGIPAARYQDKNTGVAEAELRWNVTPRWGVVGFMGAGRAWGSQQSFSDASSAVSKGLGLRYLLARRVGLWMGLDYAKGPEDSTVYVTVGNSWR
ncbi:BamA/TamA family outer membrane protein [Roseateles violae]|uniref:BamA/TamA family outer membrane protein n=1 Tax=Roseateles violae TaxID=3058042 RepID=A0ABT8DZX6_9BURK|nr:BamA/TamA family outer membrane protein [Pelomonas sp. PFR6]MDN3923104.1 BamA/TamA family outer membrane protein [Pelomonas sp. PFR6]